MGRQHSHYGRRIGKATHLGRQIVRKLRIQGQMGEGKEAIWIGAYVVEHLWKSEVTISVSPGS
jgi:hypothetical protein